VSPYTVVAIEPGLDDTLLVKAKPWNTIPGSEIWRPFECDPDSMPAWTHDGAVQAHGTILRQKLSQHPGVAAALSNVLSTPLSARHPIYFQLQAGVAERLRWETLWDDKEQFLALDSRWPIARIAESTAPFQSSPPRTFAPPLKVLAMLSALGVKAERQWGKLYAAVEHARLEGLGIELAVFAGEEDLLAAIQKGIDHGTVTGVRAAPIPQNSVQVAAAFDAFKPHILHLFCHGSAAFGKSQIELATITDWDLGKSSVLLGVKELLPALRSVWLVTLNCCEGGKSVGNVHSMAHRLVVEGAPAAVGMLEPIDAGDAHEFCGAFYSAVFQTLRRIQEAPAGMEVEIEWVEALYPPRSVLSESHPLPVNRPEWTLPVLYVRPGEFRVTREAAAPDPGVQEVLRRKVDLVAGILRELPPDTPEGVRDQILDTLAGVPSALRPDRGGNFPGAIRGT